MLIKSVTILCLAALAHSATIQRRDIPVEIIYEDPGLEGSAVTNLDEKVQLSAKELAEINEVKDESEETVGPAEEKLSAVKNLDEKVQLSPDELNVALKRITIAENVEEITPIKTSVQIPKIQLATQEPDVLNVEGVLQQAEDIISSGLKKLRISFKPDKDQQEPNPAQWEDLEKSVTEYLTEEKNKLQLKQQQPGQPPENQNIFQNIASGFTTIATNFIQNLQGTGQNTTTNQGDEQQGGGNPGGFQGFVSFFQGGVNNIANSIGSLGGQGSTTSNTVLGDSDTGATTQAPGIISSFVNNVQQFFGQIPGGSGSATGPQGDTGVNNTASSGPQGPAQVIQTIGNAISQFIQGTRPPGTSGDEGTATTQASLISVIQNNPLNPFRPPQTQKPIAATSQNPIQAGISGVQSIGNQIQQLIPGQASTEAAKQPEDQIAVEQNNQVVEELPATKGVILEQSADAEAMKEEEIKQEQMEEEIKQEEIKEEIRQEEMKEEMKQEEIKQEELKQEEKKEEILMTVE